MQTRTWPYGTQKRVKLLESHRRREQNVPVQLVVDESDHEGYFLVGETCCDFSLEVGQHGVFTFTNGGPTGGYWKLTADKPSP